MARDARDLTTLWRDIEEVTDALEAAIAQLVRSPQPHEKLVEALIIGKSCCGCGLTAAEHVVVLVATAAASSTALPGQQSAA
jgi:uncharacterized protein (UPF0212 family)